MPSAQVSRISRDHQGGRRALCFLRGAKTLIIWQLNVTASTRPHRVVRVRV